MHPRLNNQKLTRNIKSNPPLSTTATKKQGIAQRASNLQTAEFPTPRSVRAAPQPSTGIKIPKPTNQATISDQPSSNIPSRLERIRNVKKGLEKSPPQISSHALDRSIEPTEDSQFSELFKKEQVLFNRLRSRKSNEIATKAVIKWKEHVRKKQEERTNKADQSYNRRLYRLVFKQWKKKKEDRMEIWKKEFILGARSKLSILQQFFYKWRTKLYDLRCQEDVKLEEAAKRANMNVMSRAIIALTCHARHTRWKRDLNQLADHHFISQLILKYFRYWRWLNRQRTLWEQSEKYREFVLKKVGLQSFKMNRDLHRRRRNQRLQSKKYDLFSSKRKYFQIWAIKAKLKIEKRELKQVKLAIEHYDTTLVRKTFHSILYYVDSNRHSKALIREADRHYLLRYASQYFEALKLYRDERVKQKTTHQKVIALSNRNLIARYFNVWLCELVRFNRKRAYELEATRLYLFNTKRYFFQIWWMETQKNVVDLQKHQSALRFNAFRLMFRALKAFTLYQKHRQIKLDEINKSTNIYSFFVKNRYFNYWKREQTIRDANQLDEETAQTFYSQLCYRTYFRHWISEYNSNMELSVWYRKAEQFHSAHLKRKVMQSLSLYAHKQKEKEELMLERVKLIQQPLNRKRLQRIFSSMKQYYHSRILSNLENKRAHSSFVKNLLKRCLKAWGIYLSIRKGKNSRSEEATTCYCSVLRQKILRLWRQRLQERYIELNSKRRADIFFSRKTFQKVARCFKLFSQMRKEKGELTLQALEKHKRILLERALRQFLMRGVERYDNHVKHQVQREMPISMESVSIIVRYFSTWKFHLLKKQEKKRINLVRSIVTAPSTSSPFFLSTIEWKRPPPRRPIELLLDNEQHNDKSEPTMMPPNTSPNKNLNQLDSVSRVKYLTSELMTFFGTMEPKYMRELEERKRIRQSLEREPNNVILKTRLAVLEEDAREFLRFKKNKLPLLQSELMSVKSIFN